jgi:hypothetical protein
LLFFKLNRRPVSVALMPARMKLPNSELATVPERKVTHYLLNPAHPAGGSKAWFFLRFGFTVGEWQRLADALLGLARENEVVETEMTPTAGVTSWTARSSRRMGRA